MCFVKTGQVPPFLPWHRPQRPRFRTKVPPAPSPTSRSESPVRHTGSGIIFLPWYTEIMGLSKFGLRLRVEAQGPELASSSELASTETGRLGLCASPVPRRTYGPGPLSARRLPSDLLLGVRGATCHVSVDP